MCAVQNGRIVVPWGRNSSCLGRQREEPSMSASSGGSQFCDQRGKQPKKRKQNYPTGILSFQSAHFRFRASLNLYKDRLFTILFQIYLFTPWTQWLHRKRDFNKKSMNLMQIKNNFQSCVSWTHRITTILKFNMKYVFVELPYSGRGRLFILRKIVNRWTFIKLWKWNWLDKCSYWVIYRSLFSRLVKESIFILKRKGMAY